MQTAFRPKLPLVPLLCAPTLTSFCLLVAPSAGGDVLRVPGDHPTIQAAVTAARNGDTIQIAAGLYEEQLLIQAKNLTLQGSPGTVIRARRGMAQQLGWLTVAMVAIDRCTNLVLRGITFDGDRLGKQAYGFYGYAGILYHGSGGRVEECVIRGFRDRDALDNFGTIGLWAVNPVAPSVPDLQIVRCHFLDNGNSIHVRGADDARAAKRLTFLIRDNLIEGIGPTALGSQVGIWISCGASGTVVGNRITDHYLLQANTERPFLNSFGILAIYWRHARNPTVLQADPLLSVRYENNALLANQSAIFSIASPRSEFVNNYFHGPAPRISAGLGITGPSNRIASNSFYRVTQGIVLLGQDPEYSAIGRATDPTLAGNCFCEVGTPVVTQPLVSGVTESDTQTCPFPAPTLAIESAVVLTWPAYQPDFVLESAANLNGPWAALDTFVTVQGNSATATVKATSGARYFRLRKP